MDRDSGEFVGLITGAQTAVLAYIISLGFEHARAKDILQETNITMWKKADTFEDGSNFQAWACRIAYYHVLNHRRRAYREQLVFDDDLFDYLAERQEQRAASVDVRESALQSCLGKLSDEHRALITERYQPGASVQAMADVAGKTEAAISQALFRIRGTLQACISRQMTQEEAV